MGPSRSRGDEVAARTLIRIDKDDPAFATATLIDVACEKALDQIEARLDATIVEFEHSALKLLGRMAAMLVLEIQKKLVVPESKVTGAESEPDTTWVEIPLAHTVIVFGSGFLLGIAIALEML